MSYDEVADALNDAGIRTSRGTEYEGGRGTAHFLKEAAVQLHEDGDEEGCELVRQITSHDGYYSDYNSEFDDSEDDEEWDDEEYDEDDDCDEDDDEE